MLQLVKLIPLMLTRVISVKCRTPLLFALQRILALLLYISSEVIFETEIMDVIGCVPGCSSRDTVSMYGVEELLVSLIYCCSVIQDTLPGGQGRSGDVLM